jgi:tRNA threonylcarbamoyladenosine biosynthesis protein TsaE
MCQCFGVIELVLNDEEETLALARALAGVLAPGDLVALEGGLGAGKTTFARGAIHGLAVPAETAITSPTFALLHQYQGRLPIAHADFYRLADDAELEELGVDELLEEGSVLFVEWGRKFPWVESRASLWVDLEIVSDDVRRVRLCPQGERGEELIAGLKPLL